MSIVVFHRGYKRFQGGHLKVFHYFEHVRSSPSHEARIRFSPDSVWGEGNPWRGVRETVIGPGKSVPADVLFLAGMDWRWLAPEQRAILIVADHQPRPGLWRHARQGPATRVHRASRDPDMCQRRDPGRTGELGSVAGPIFTIPIGIDLESAARGASGRRARHRLRRAGPQGPSARTRDRRTTSSPQDIGCCSSITRSPGTIYSEAMARARVTVHLPGSLEGAYLPALESMAVGAAVVCPDCVGNRSFCRDGDTCLVPDRSETGDRQGRARAPDGACRHAGADARLGSQAGDGAQAAGRAHPLPGDRRARRRSLGRQVSVQDSPAGVEPVPGAGGSSGPSGARVTWTLSSSLATAASSPSPGTLMRKTSVPAPETVCSIE